MRVIEQLVYKIGSDTSQFDGGVKKSSNLLAKFATGLGAAVMLRALQKELTASAKAYGVFEQSMAKASTLFGDVDVDMDNLQKQTIELSRATGLAADQIGNALYQALSAGVPVTEDMGEAVKFLEGATKLSRAGFTTMETAVDATTKTLNAYGLEISEASRIQQILIQTQNRGITTVDELGGFLAQVTPTAAAMNVEFENIGAALAVMTAQGTRTRNAVTQLNSIISELGQKGTTASDALATAAENAGLAETTFGEMMDAGMDLGEVLQLMRDFADESNLSMLDLFGSVEAGKGALSLTGDSVDIFSRNLAEMRVESNAVGDAYDRVMDTMNSQTELLKNNIETLRIEMGARLAPAIVSTVQALNALVTRMSESYTRTGQLAGQVDELIKLNDDYKVALKNVEDGTDDVSASMLEQIGIQRRLQLMRLEESYFGSRKELEKLNTTIEKNRVIWSTNRSALEQIASSIGMTRQELAGLNNIEAVLGSVTYREYKDRVDAVNESYINYTEAIGKAKSAEIGRDQFIRALSQAYLDGIVDIEQFIEIDKDLYDQVIIGSEAILLRSDALETAKTNIDKLKDAELERINTNIEYWESAAEGILREEMLNWLHQRRIELLEREAIGQDKNNTLNKEQESIIQGVSSDLEKLNRLHALLGDELDINAERATIFQGAIIALSNSGIDPANETLQEYIRSLRESQSTTEEAYETMAQASMGFSEAVRKMRNDDRQNFIYNLEQQVIEFSKAKVDEAEIAEWYAQQLMDFDEQVTEKSIAEADKRKMAQIASATEILGHVTSVWSGINQARANANQKYLDQMKAEGKSEENIANQKKKFAIEEAKTDKALRSMQTIVDTAAGIVRAWVSPGFPLALGLSPLIAGVGIAQLAAINSAPLPSFDVGSIRVPQDTQAIVHRNEMILPAEIAQQARQEGIQIAPTGGGGTPAVMQIFLDGKKIAESGVEYINSGQVGIINTRVVR